MEFEEVKKSINLVDYIINIGGQLQKAGNNTYRLNPCPVCGHKDHFTIYPENNSYYSFSDCCVGGSIIDYMIEVEGLNKTQAINKVKKLAGSEGSNNQPTSPMRLVGQEEKSKKLSEIEIKDTSLMVKKALSNKCDYYYNRGLSDKTINNVSVTHTYTTNQISSTYLS